MRYNPLQTFHDYEKKNACSFVYVFAWSPKYLGSGSLRDN